MEEAQKDHLNELKDDNDSTNEEETLNAITGLVNISSATGASLIQTNPA